MTEPIQPSLALGKPHRNQYLFADHYLEEILRRDDAVWAAAIPEAQLFLGWLRDLYAHERGQLADYAEAQLEDNWIKPILVQLGHIFEVQATVPGLEHTIKKPDYVFFPDETARQAAVRDQRTEDYARHALAVGEVKAWPVNLSKKLAGAPVFDNNNPMFQIDYYLKATGLRWGIVTNGRVWRLVHKDTSYKLDIYFEVDLVEALTTADETHALAIATYFLVFFRQASFLPGEDGRVLLDDVLAGSARYAVALESDLRDNAYKALEQIILGFFAPAANGMDPDSPADRDRVYRNSLLLLYRLLFLFYGESRGLLPMRNPDYATRSLTKLADKMAVDVENNTSHPPMTREYWDRLQGLFRLISGDQPDLNAYLGVPRYNGGLFDAQRHPFLETYYVGDAHLVRAIDYLARRRVSQNGRYAGRERVDYRTLGVRQLGSIYEGLLEYKVSKAEAEMVTVRKGGKETWIPATERGRSTALETRQPGELYLATDKGERKATGSYYTPDYIVKYIVEQTLGPLIAEARERVKTRVAASDLREETDRQALGARLFEEEILKLNVLDPAMGSGHFLVDATNYLARALATDDFTTAAGDGTDEADLTYWQRRVVEACIYGVDKNELAVELAKLSLWLVTVSGDKPLSFLDHHLRHGDSLIGAWLKDLAAPPKPTRPDRSHRPVRSKTATDPLFDEGAFTTSAGLAVGGVARIEGLPTVSIDDVHAKEDTWRQIHDTHLARWRQLADLWVSAWFGNDMSAEEYADLARRIQGRGGALLSDEQAARFLDHPAVTDNDYFHWELEFPEVFFDEYGRSKGEAAGFDAVVGNPPYVNANELNKTLSVNTKPYWRTVYESAEGAYDLYVLFIERALQLISTGRISGLITPNKYLSAPYATALRRYLSEQHTVRSLYDASRLGVFEEAAVYPIVTLLKKGKWNEHVDVRVAVSQYESRTYQHDQKMLSLLPDQIWGFLLSNGIAMLSRISVEAVPLGEVAEVVASTTAAEADLFSSALRELNSMKNDVESLPILNTGLIDRYASLWGSKDFTHQGHNYHKPMLELNNSVVPQRRRDMYQLPKLVFAKVALRVEAFCDIEGSYASMNTNFAIPRDLDIRLLVALCNSRLMSYIYAEYFAALSMSGGYMQFQAPQLSILPIPKSAIQPISEGIDSSLESTKVREIYKADGPDDLMAVLDSESSAGDYSFPHYLLAYLSDQMIILHQDKQALVADFWTDLEGATGDPTTFSKLRNSGKQEASLAREAAARPFVNSDSRSSRRLDDSLGWDEAAFKAFVRLLAGSVSHLSALTHVYNDYAPRYKELVERIERTDWLIDQIVYKLYGLTDEEIAIVEGS